MAFSGTAVTQGLGEGIVVATGLASQIGQISKLAQEADEEASPWKNAWTGWGTSWSG